MSRGQGPGEHLHFVDVEAGPVELGLALGVPGLDESGPEKVVDALLVVGEDVQQAATLPGSCQECLLKSVKRLLPF